MEIRVRDVPADVHRRYKALCALEGTSVAKSLREYMAMAVKAKGGARRVKA